MDKGSENTQVNQEAFQTAATRVSVISMATNVVLTLLKLAAGLIARSGAANVYCSIRSSSGQKMQGYLSLYNKSARSAG